MTKSTQKSIAMISVILVCSILFGIYNALLIGFVVFVGIPHFIKDFR